MKRLALFLLILTACTRHPSPGPAIEKVNGVQTVHADDAAVRGEDYGRKFSTLTRAPKFPVVYFEYDSDRITEAYADGLSNVIRDVGGSWTCRVEGHASDEGTTDYNLALGERRAYRVSQYMQSFPGIYTETKSYGEEKPAGIDPVQNRRVEIRCK